MSDNRLIRIGELSKRAGLSIRALRYYEEIGILQPTARTPAGYRLYDGSALTVLDMVKRMKLLGLPLAALGELQTIHRDQGRCAPVRQRFQAMLEQRIRRIDEQVAELLALRRDLATYVEEARRRTEEPDLLEERCARTLRGRDRRTAPQKGAEPDAHQGRRSAAPGQVPLLRR